jgi:hypothetical protein
MVHVILDLMGVGDFCFQVYDLRDGHEVMTFALQPWLKTSALGPCQKERGMELCPFLPSPHLSARAGPGALGGELGRGAGTSGGGAPKRAPGGVLLRR